MQRVLKHGARFEAVNGLPEAVAFDEFKGNAGGERFQCIVADPLGRRVFDILPSTEPLETIQDYLRTFPNRGRGEVRRHGHEPRLPGRRQKAFLPNAKIIIDRFHVVRYYTEAMENVRQ